MKLKEDQQRIKDLLKDTITLLCKNGLHYKAGFSVEALIGITLDEDDVFLVNIKETVTNDAFKEGLGVEVTVHRQGEEEESGNEEVSHRKTSDKRLGRKRPPDGSPSFSDLPSPSKLSRTEMDDASNASKDSHFNIKAEPDDEDDLVFVKQEGTDFSSCSQANQNTPFVLGNVRTASQSAMVTNQGFQNPNFPSQSFDTSAENLPGMSAWNPDQSQGNLTGAQSFTSSSAQQESYVCEQCLKRFKTKGYLQDHLRGVHKIGSSYQCSCGFSSWWRNQFIAHRRTCESYLKTGQYNMI